MPNCLRATVPRVVVPALALLSAALGGACGDDDDTTGMPADGAFSEELTVEEAMAFDEFELFWLGEEFMGHELRGIVHQEYDLPQPASSPFATHVDSVTFLYGDCTPVGEDEPSCTLPISLHVDAYCSKPPALILGPHATDDGDYSAKVDSHSYGYNIWTSDAFIDLNVSDSGLSVMDAVDALRSMRPGGRQPGEEFNPITVPGC